MGRTRWNAAWYGISPGSVLFVKSKEGKDQETMQSSTSDKNARKHNPQVVITRLQTRQYKTKFIDTIYYIYNGPYLYQTLPSEHSICLKRGK